MGTPQVPHRRNNPKNPGTYPAGRGKPKPKSSSRYDTDSSSEPGGGAARKKIPGLKEEITMNYELLDWDEMEYGDIEDQERIADMGAKGPDSDTIRIIASGGVVDDVQNLPYGWTWEILDHDDADETGEDLANYKAMKNSKPDPHTVRIEMSGGTLDDIRNLPRMKNPRADARMTQTKWKDLSKEERRDWLDFAGMGKVYAEDEEMSPALTDKSLQDWLASDPTSDSNGNLW